MSRRYRRVHLVNSWFVRCVTLRRQEGGLPVPPPVLTRVYQEHSVT